MTADRRQRLSPRRGLALLLVLAALVIGVTSAAMLVVLAASARAQRDADRHTAWADDLSRGAESMLAVWLVKDSTKATVPLEVEEPRVPVINDRWTAGGVEHELRITAYDLCGMVPWDDARSGSAIRQALPGAVRQRMDRAPVGAALGTGLAPGLDLVPAGRPGDEAVRYPVPPTLPALAFGRGDAAAGSRSTSPESGASPQKPPPAVGAWIATHAANADIAVVNINTAPAALLERAFRETKRSGLDGVLAARKVHAQAILPQVPRPAVRPSTPPPPEKLVLATSSDAWAFRVDATVGRTVRSWWLVYTRSSSGPWQLVQRLEVVE